MSEPWNPPVDVGDAVCPKCRKKTGEGGEAPRTLRDVLDRIDARSCCRTVKAYVAAVRRTYAYLVETRGARAAEIGSWSDGTDPSERIDRAWAAWRTATYASAIADLVAKEGPSLEWPSVDGSHIREFLDATKSRPSAASVAKAAQELLEQAREAAEDVDRDAETSTWASAHVRKSVEEQIASGSQKVDPPPSVAFAVSPTLVVVATLQPVRVGLFDTHGKELQ